MVLLRSLMLVVMRERLRAALPRGLATLPHPALVSSQTVLIAYVRPSPSFPPANPPSSPSSICEQTEIHHRVPDRRQLTRSSQPSARA